MNRRLIDTNVIVRHLVQDQKSQGEAAKELFKASDQGRLVLVVLLTVLAECVFVLEFFYNKPRQEIASVLIRLLGSRGIEVQELAIHLDALKRYELGKNHFVDCTIAAKAAADKLPVATFDRGFRQFSDVKVDVGAA